MFFVESDHIGTLSSMSNQGTDINQIRSSFVDGNNHILQLQSDADSQLLAENANTGFDIANEIKRWQQIHQSNNSNPQTALLQNGGSNLTQNPDASTAASFLQQILESQNYQQQRGGSSSRFDIPLASSLSLSGNSVGQMIGNDPINISTTSDFFNSNEASTNESGMGLSHSNNGNATLNSNVNNSLTNGNYYTDAHRQLLMAQQAVAAMNFPSFSNPVLFQQPSAPMQSQQPTFPQLPPSTQHIYDPSTSITGSSLEIPLPSPHSLFHRDGTRRMRGGVIEPFPEKLHRLLLEVESAERSDIISFVSSGRAFQIHKADKFFKDIVPLYFRQSRLSSFKRQLNLYGFELINTGPARGGYFHELFIKDQPELCRRMRRVAIKLGGKTDVAKSEEQQQEATAISSDPIDFGRFDF